MMHAKRHHVMAMDDTKYKVAQLLNKPGDKATYSYDLGDKWVTCTTRMIDCFAAPSPSPSARVGYDLYAMILPSIAANWSAATHNAAACSSDAAVCAARTEVGRDCQSDGRASMRSGVCCVSFVQSSTAIAEKQAETLYCVLLLCSWYHTLTLVEVLPPEQSDGTCKVCWAGKTWQNIHIGMSLELRLTDQQTSCHVINVRSCACPTNMLGHLVARLGCSS
jgi:hypothetical protein